MKKNRTLYLLIVIIFILCCVAGVIIAARMSLEKVKVTYEEVVNEEVVSEELVSEAPELQDEYIAIADEKDYKEMAWDYSLISDVVYGQAEGESGTEDLQLDIYRTTKEGMNPAIILFHGGGLTSGDKASAGLLKSLAIDYAKAAYDWMLVNGAEYGADTKYVAIGGYSSGADISINMCYSNYFADLNRESILCVIDISGGDIYYGIEKDTMPGCVIVHGTNDTTVSFSKSENTAKFLESKNIDVELNALEGLNHDLLSRYEEVRNMIAEYMYQCLTGEEVTISIQSEISPEYQKVLDRMDNGIAYDVKPLEVTVDGSLDEWEGMDVIELNQLKDAGASLPAEDDFSGEIMLAWQESNPTTLYIAAKIKDDDIKDNVPADGKWYQDDCLEIVFDTSDEQMVQQLTKWVVGAGGKDLSVLANTENTVVSMTESENEYIYEMSIDISNVPSGTFQGDGVLEFSPEKSIGFSISYNDGEEGDRQHQIGWTSGKSSDRTTLGTLNFKF